jgi:hypothetical protein
VGGWVGGQGGGGGQAGRSERVRRGRGVGAGRRHPFYVELRPIAANCPCPGVLTPGPTHSYALPQSQPQRTEAGGGGRGL